jgi:hypothetical protein
LFRQKLPIYPRRRGHLLQDRVDGGRNSGALVPENARANGRDKEHPAPVPENIQPGLAQACRQFLHHLRR